MLWSIVSKATDKSKRACRETFPSSRARRRSENQFFNYLGDKGKIGDRTIVLQFILVKRFFLEERCNKSSFENFRKDAGV